MDVGLAVSTNVRTRTAIRKSFDTVMISAIIWEFMRTEGTCEIGEMWWRRWGWEVDRWVIVVDCNPAE